jgi:hypothetical protein
MIGAPVGRAGTLVALAAAASLVVGAPGAAAATWSPAKTISQPNELSDAPKVALNGRGHAAVVWSQLDGSGDVIAMRSATRTPGEGFGDPQTLGPASEAGGANPPSFPTVAIDRRGNAVAMWLFLDGDGNTRVAASYQRVGGEFGPMQTVSDAGQPAFNPDVAFDKRGRAVAAWSRFDGAISRIQTAVIPAGKRRFGAATTISPPGSAASFPSIGVSDRGRAVAVWATRQMTPPFNFLVAASQRPRGGEFGPAQTISEPGINSNDARVVVSRQGDAIAMWVQDETATTHEVATAFAPRGEEFAEPQPIPAEPGMDAESPRLGVDRRGRATLVWLETPPESTPGTNIVRTARTDSTARVQSQAVLDSQDIDILQPAVGVARAGNAIAAWVPVPPNPPDLIRTAARGRRAAGFGASETLNPPGVSGAGPSLAASRKLGLAVWEISTGVGGSGILANTLRRR